MKIDPKDVREVAAQRAREAKAEGRDKVRIMAYLGKDAVQPLVDEGLLVELVGCFCPVFEESIGEATPAFCEEILRPAMRGWGFDLRILDCNESAEAYGF